MSISKGMVKLIMANLPLKCYALKNNIFELYQLTRGVREMLGKEQDSKHIYGRILSR